MLPYIYSYIYLESDLVSHTFSLWASHVSRGYSHTLSLGYGDLNMVSELLRCFREDRDLHHGSIIGASSSPSFVDRCSSWSKGTSSVREVPSYVRVLIVDKDLTVNFCWNLLIVIFCNPESCLSIFIAIGAFVDLQLWHHHRGRRNGRRYANLSARM